MVNVMCYLLPVWSSHELGCLVLIILYCENNNSRYQYLNTLSVTPRALIPSLEASQDHQAFVTASLSDHCHNYRVFMPYLYRTNNSSFIDLTSFFPDQL